ncbi:hypothetical protein [Nocardioides xinjiangensis]|uniref:hypothetical protein n=1 Tax=Nocardioides xinjiangensis TaxID=2817376 RepID=UPI001B309264|nr:MULTISPECIES: hypothetical protein [unclassified Nocardioides]
MEDIAKTPTCGGRMWDTVETSTDHLSHDLPCAGCGHGRHTYLPCSDTCDCAHGRDRVLTTT